ncbi:MAG: hypothetical protein IJ091_00705, partial [Oscillospiraceae bacterium]|nr:hypothetical protein [Oscillospiraceae bacterium]
MATKKKKDSVSIHERWVSEIPEQFISGKKKKPTKADIELAKRMAEMREREQRVEMARNINKHDLELWIKRNSEK